MTTSIYQTLLWCFVASALLLSGCGSEDGVQLDDAFVCEDRPDDNTGYLKPICEYLVINYQSYSIDPNELQITRIEPGSKASYPVQGYNTDAYDYVYLSCCYTGDLAIMSVETKTVLRFIVGDI